MEKAAIKRLDGHELVAKYPEEFADSVERDFNFCILTQTIHRNHRQDLEVSLQIASKGVKFLHKMFYVNIISGPLRSMIYQSCQYTY